MDTPSDNKNHKKHKKALENPVALVEHKDKHNKLRETIEKLKAKSEISSKLKDKNLPNIITDDNKMKFKENIYRKHNEKNKRKERTVFDMDFDDGNSTAGSIISDNKNFHKKGPNSKTVTNKNVEIEALTLATEQTLKDINKWLDDTPRFSEYSSASNSPSHYISIEDFDAMGNKNDLDYRKKCERTNTRKDVSKDLKRRVLQRDPVKFLKRREVQRTIDRLQPGKSKGNLISNMQNQKPDELFPLGPMSKMKESKNSLIVKPDDGAPKLSLGTVLDSFGKHKFIDDPKRDDEDDEEKEPKTESKTESPSSEKISKGNVEDLKKEEEVEKKPASSSVKENNASKPTPNLSAWFKAFGAPKTQQVQKKAESKEASKPDGSPKSVPDSKRDETKKVTPPEPSPNPESPIAMHGQPAVRQRKISTGSSMSERSSFSQDMDSPRVGIDERLGAYPAPYPSPLHRSPSGASPVMASPRADLSPKAPSYPTFNGQIRVGFYQDTVSTKSSPDKSCSPRDGVQSPYNQYPEHMYTPHSTTQMAYSYGNPPYYSQPNYSTTNPTPPYGAESTNSPSFYDTSKPLTDQYQAKIIPTYSGSLSNESSPSPQQHSPSVDTARSDDKPDKFQSQSAVFPVKKRAYNETEPSQMGRYETTQSQEYNRNVDMGMVMGRQLGMSNARGQDNTEETSKQFSHENITDPKPAEVFAKASSGFAAAHQNNAKQAAVQEQDAMRTSTAYPGGSNSSYNTSYNVESPYPLNIPTARPAERQDMERKVDMSKYTNMGYTGTDMSFARNSPQYARSDLNYARSSSVASQIEAQHSSANSQMNMAMRYANAGINAGYKDIGAPTSSSQQTSHLGNLGGVASHQVPRSSAENRMTYGNPTIDVDQTLGLRENLANLTHIVDRFSADDRMLSGLQSSASSYYANKNLAGAHMFSKPIATSASGLPIFSQPNMAIPYSHEMQATASTMYDRQMTELQNPAVVNSEKGAPQVQQEKKSKRRKGAKTGESFIFHFLNGLSISF